jgi:hypothetical protein
VRGIALDVGALRSAEDGSLLCVANGGYVPWPHLPR